MHNLVSSGAATESQIAADGTSGSKRGERPATDQATMWSDNSEASVRLAEQAIGRQQWGAAARHVARALELNPDNGRAWALKGQLEELSGRDAEALGAYHRAVSCDAQNPEAALRLAAIQIEHGRAAQTAQIMRNVLKCPLATAEQKSRAQWLLGVAYVRMARWNQALPVLDEAARTRDMSADDWYLVAMARFRAGDIAGARRDVEQQLELHPDHRGFASLLADLNYVEAHRGEILPATNFAAPKESPAMTAPVAPP